MIDLLPTGDQQQIVEAVSGVLADQFPIERLRDREPGRREREKWSDLAALGWLGLGIDQALGGSGLTSADEALTFRAFGRHLVGPSILGTVLAAHAAASAGMKQLLGQILSGERRAGLARPIAGATLGPSLKGPFYLIDCDAADLVVSWNADGLALVERPAFGDLESRLPMDWAVSLLRGTAAGGLPLVWIAAGAATLTRRADLMVAAMHVGIAEASRDMAVAYAKLREQFGQKIGSFQAVKHRCADMAVRAEAAWTQTAFAAIALAEGKPGIGFETVAARILANDAAIRNAEANIQVHGGIGFTAQADPHWFVKRAHLLAQLGPAIRQQQRALMAMPEARPG
jgi:alkylation response protein AidB-like acyl-CoA dehydrogenase